MLRFSHYSILSERLPRGGYVLMNGISGALDLVSDGLGQSVEDVLYRGGDPSSVIATLAPETRADFVERGHLTEAAEEEERAQVVDIAAAFHERVRGNPHFMIVPNLDCNYRCTYCFERPMQRALKVLDSEISYHRSNVVMTEPMVDHIFAGIRTLKAEVGKEPGGQIILYGGEPLDRTNSAVVRYIVKRGREQGYYFAAITNGHDLDHYGDLLGIGSIEQVQISIDGPKEVHDKRRIHLGRESSFDKIVANLRKTLPETTAQIQLRVHVDAKNLGHFEEVLGFFASEGWVNHAQVVIYANTVYAKSADGKVGVSFSHSEIAERLRHVTAGMTNVFLSAPDVHADRALRPAFEEGERVASKGTYCSANSGNYIFAADSRIYACWESVGKACSRLGEYDAGGLRLDAAAVQKWFGRSIATLDECQRCAFALQCGGGCAQYAEYNEGSIYKPYCDDFQRTFRSALANTSSQYLEQVT